MTIGTVCSGIGAPEVAFGGEGFEPLWFSEIEKFPSAVLAHHYPDVVNLGDFTSDEAIDYMVANPPDVFVGGTPCQSFSVAGKRGSLDDDRGNLTLIFTEVWHRLRAVGTRYAVWENVPGVLNTKDNAFGCFVSAMVGADTVIESPNGKWQSAGLADGPRGCIAWRVLDAQYWGVPQRRRRVFAVIGHPGDFSVAKILFERESVFGDSAQSRETGQEATRAVGEGVEAAGFNFEMWSGECIEASPALQARRAKDNLVYESKAFAQNTRDEVRYIGGDGQVTGALAAETGMKQQSYVYENHPNDSRVKGPLDVCEQLTARNGTGGGNLPLVQEAAYWNGEDVASTHPASMLAKQQMMPEKNRFNCVIEPIPIHDQATRHSGKRGSNQDGKGNGLGVGKEGEPMNTLTKGDKHAVAFNWQSGGDVRHNPSASGTDALTAHQTPACFLPTQGSKAQGIGYSEKSAPTLRSGCSDYGLQTGMQVRRLTPVECERLQGFPDNWTRIPWRSKPPEQCPDGPRYKAIGNSMAIPCVAFIAARISHLLNNSKK